MALNESPVGTYANVTGIVNATAAPQITTLFATLKSFIQDPTSQTDQAGSPDFLVIPPAAAQQLRDEIDAVAAAIAAAPTI